MHPDISVTPIQYRDSTHSINDLILVVCESIKVLGDRILVLATLLVGATISHHEYT